MLALAGSYPHRTAVTAHAPRGDQPKYASDADIRAGA
jgi:hypothetical protein